MPLKNETAAQKLKIAERRQLAVELRKQGGTYRQIADQLARHPEVSGDYTASQAYRDVAAELKRLQAETSKSTAELRQLELERLDDLWRIYFPRALKGDYAAFDRVLAIMDKRARLIADLYPTKSTSIEVSGPNGGPVMTEDASLTDDERMARLVALFDAARARRDRQTPPDD